MDSQWYFRQLSQRNCPYSHHLKSHIIAMLTCCWEACSRMREKSHSVNISNLPQSLFSLIDTSSNSRKLLLRGSFMFGVCCVNLQWPRRLHDWANVKLHSDWLITCSSVTWSIYLMGNLSPLAGYCMNLCSDWPEACLPITVKSFLGIQWCCCTTSWIPTWLQLFEGNSCHIGCTQRASMAEVCTECCFLLCPCYNALSLKRATK